MLDFLIAGVQKGGTTALRAFLSCHPDIYFPDRKELHFFDNESFDWSRPNYALLHRHFCNKRPGQIAGEATPIYTYWQPSTARIHRYNPHVKLIVLLRNPVERAYSHWAMEVRRGAETLEFSDSIRIGRERLGGKQHRVYSYVERGFYAEQTERLASLFPASQLLLLRTEDLREQHTATLDRICKFIGVRRFVTHPAARNVSAGRWAVPKAKQSDLDYLVDLYRCDIERTQQLTGLDLSTWLERSWVPDAAPAGLPPADDNSADMST
jgi:hypothetical protein